VCVKTGRVAEFKDDEIEKRLRDIAKELGYSLTEHRIILYGVHGKGTYLGQRSYLSSPRRASLRHVADSWRLF